MNFNIRLPKIIAIILVIILVINLILFAFALVSLILFWVILGMIAAFVWWLLPRMKK